MESETMLGLGLAAGLGYVFYSLLFTDPVVAETENLDKLKEEVSRGKISLTTKKQKSKVKSPRSPVFIEEKFKEEPEVQEKKKGGKDVFSPMSDPVKKTFEVSKKEKAKQLNKGFEVVAKRSTNSDPAEKKKRSQLAKLEKALEKQREEERKRQHEEWEQRQAERKKNEEAKAEKEASGEGESEGDAKAAKLAAEKAAEAKKELSAQERVRKILEDQREEKKKAAEKNNKKGGTIKVYKNEEEDVEGEEAEKPKKRTWEATTQEGSLTEALAADVEDEKLQKKLAPKAFPTLA